MELHHSTQITEELHLTGLGMQGYFLALEYLAKNVK